MASKKLTKEQWFEVEQLMYYLYSTQEMAACLEKKQRTLYRLVTLRSRLAKGKVIKRYGLCSNIANQMMVVAISRYWNYYSGDMLYPVPITEKRFATKVKQYSLGEKWEGKQLKLRLELAEFLLLNFNEFFKLLEKIIKQGK